MARVTGIGGVFLKAKDPKALKAWYAQYLGVVLESYGSATFQWSDEVPAGTGMTTWALFPETTEHFGGGPQTAMINYRVDDLDALLEKLRHLRPAHRDRPQARRLRLRPLRLDQRPRRQPPRTLAAYSELAPYLFREVTAKIAPCGSNPCTIHAPPGTSCGPIITLPPALLIRSTAASTLSTLK